MTFLVYGCCTSSMSRRLLSIWTQLVSSSKSAVDRQFSSLSLPADDEQISCSLRPTVSLKLCPSDLAAEGQISCSPQPTVSLKGCPSDLAADTLISCPSDVVETTVTNSSAAAACSRTTAVKEPISCSAAAACSRTTAAEEPIRSSATVAEEPISCPSTAAEKLTSFPIAAGISSGLDREQQLQPVNQLVQWWRLLGAVRGQDLLELEAGGLKDASRRGSKYDIARPWRPTHV